MEGSGHALHGGIRGIPLKSVRDDDEGLRAVIAVPIEIEKISVRGLDALPLTRDEWNAPEEHRQDRLEMTIRQPPWRSVGGVGK
jgi:hypothetical protein